MVPTILILQQRSRAIVGAGFSGSLVTTHLLKTANRPLLIKPIERDRHIGKGVAHTTTNSRVGLFNH
ncbi:MULTISPECIES: FAD/NAD(P)-binding protein [unclassified Microcoleus]|uniref:FAD/NAD(P)-binding protein n=1 Tax=unclassified Microcoleus TaxID=2642155 RepID=UPI002FD53AAB